MLRASRFTSEEICCANDSQTDAFCPFLSFPRFRLVTAAATPPPKSNDLMKCKRDAILCRFHLTNFLPQCVLSIHCHSLASASWITLRWSSPAITSSTAWDSSWRFPRWQLLLLATQFPMFWASARLFTLSASSRSSEWDRRRWRRCSWRWNRRDARQTSWDDGLSDVSANFIKFSNFPGPRFGHHNRLPSRHDSADVYEGKEGGEGRREG